MRTYLIDVENTGNRWRLAMQAANNEDQIILFYTGNGPSISMSDLDYARRKKIDLTAHWCDAGMKGRNALDFQLTSWLGYMIGTKASHDLVIVSSDAGYDPLAKFWTSERASASVSRISPLELRVEVAEMPSNLDIESGIIETTKDIQEQGTEYNTPLRNDRPLPPSGTMRLQSTDSNLDGFTELSSVAMDSTSTAPVLEPTQDTSSKAEMAPIIAAEEQCRSVYKKRLKELDMTSQQVQKITNIIITAALMPARGRMLQVRNLMAKEFGQKEGAKIFERIRLIVQSIFDKGPMPDGKKASKDAEKETKRKAKEDELRKIYTTALANKGITEPHCSNIAQIAVKASKCSTLKSFLAETHAKINSGYGTNKGEKLYNKALPAIQSLYDRNNRLTA